MTKNPMNDLELTRFFKRDDTLTFLNSYPQVSRMFNENSAATVFALHKLGSLNVQCGDINLSASYNGEAWKGEKSYDAYSSFIQAYIEKLVHDENGIPFKTELSKARNDICLAIFNAHRRVLPDWACLYNGRNPIKGYFELYEMDSYVIDNMWVLWQAVGLITVQETARITTYDFAFFGKPEIKIALVDICQLESLEALLDEDFQDGKKNILSKAAVAKIIVRDWSFLE